MALGLASYETHTACPSKNTKPGNGKQAKCLAHRLLRLSAYKSTSESEFAPTERIHALFCQPLRRTRWLSCSSKSEAPTIRQQCRDDNPEPNGHEPAPWSRLERPAMFQRHVHGIGARMLRFMAALPASQLDPPSQPRISQCLAGAERSSKLSTKIFPFFNTAHR